MKIYLKILLSVFAISLLWLVFIGTQKEKANYMGISALHFNGGYQEGQDIYIIDESNDAGVICFTDTLKMKAGTYQVRIFYEQQFLENVVVIQADGREIFAALPLNQKEYEFSVQLEEDVDNFIVQIYYMDTGKLSIKGIELSGENLLYASNDGMFCVIILLILYVAAFLAYRYSGFKKLPVKDKLAIFMMLGVILFSSIPLIASGLPYSHDLECHIGRLEGLKEALLGGQFPGRVAMNGNQGYGWLLVLYPDLFLYVPALLRICGVSMVTVYKFMLIVINTAATLSVFLSVLSICKSEKKQESSILFGAVFAAIAYCLFPYRLINMYVRGALGESIAMIFFPVLLAGIYHVLYKDKKKWYLLVIGATGVIQTHIISIVLACVFAVLLVLCNIGRVWKEQRILSFIKAFAVTLIVNIWYIVPFLYYYLGDYTRINAIKGGEISRSIFSIREVFLDAGEEASSFGIPIYGFLTIFCMLIFITGFCLYQKEKEQLFRYCISLVIIGVLSLLITTNLMPLEVFSKFPPIRFIFSTLQFPYRFAVIVACTLTIVAGCMLVCSKGLHKYQSFIVPITIGIFILLTLPIFQNINRYIFTEEKGSGSILHAAPGYMDYWPIGAEETDLKNHKVYYAKSNIDIFHYQNGNEGVLFQYTANKAGEQVEIPLFYYPGYIAKLQDGTELPLNRGKTGRVRLELPASQKVATVMVTYREPMIFRVALVVSAMALVAFVIIGVKRYRLKR